jgi:hypothetical protein
MLFGNLILTRRTRTGAGHGDQERRFRAPCRRYGSRGYDRQYQARRRPLSHPLSFFSLDGCAETWPYSSFMVDISFVLISRWDALLPGGYLVTTTPQPLPPILQHLCTLLSNCTEPHLPHHIFYHLILSTTSTRQNHANAARRPTRLLRKTSGHVFKR